MNLPATLSAGQDYRSPGDTIASIGSTRDSSQSAKLNQVVQNLFAKAAQVIIQSRMSVPQIYARDAVSQKKTNKWFNLELNDTDAFRDELRIWKAVDVGMATPFSLPPLIIETVLDTRELTANQMLVILDDEGERWNIDAAAAASGLRADIRRPEIVLERWRIELDPRSLGEDSSLPDLPVVYKRAIVLFRTLYAYVRLLPAWRFKKKMGKAKLNPSSLKISCRILNGAYPILSRGRIGLSIPLVLDSKEESTQGYTFNKIETPAGAFVIHVTYRKNCEFRVDDSESILSSHFLNLDEHRQRRSYQMPITAKSSGTPSTSRLPRLSKSPPNSLPSDRYSPSHLPHMDPGLSYGSLSSFHHQVETGDLTDPLSARRGSPHSFTERESYYSSASSSTFRGKQTSNAERRSSIQPFKLPALSASPSAEQLQPSLGSYPRVSYRRVSSTSSGSVPQGSVSRSPASITAIPQSPASGSSVSLATALPISASPASSVGSRAGSLRRYSSSFGARSQWQHSGGSVSSSTNAASQVQAMLAQSPSSSTFAPKFDDDSELSEFVRLLDSRQPLKSFTQHSSVGTSAVGGVGMGTSAPRTSLSRFQQLRDYHSLLSDSMSASIVVSPNQQNALVTQRMSSGSYSSSGGSGSVKGVSPHTPHTPAIPSRLSEGLTAEYSRHESVFEDDDDDVGEDDGGLGRHKQSSPAHEPGLERQEEHEELVLDDSGGAVSLQSGETSRLPRGLQNTSGRGSVRPYSVSSRRGGMRKSSPGSAHSREELSIGGAQFVDDDELLFAMSDMTIATGATERERGEDRH